MEPASPLLYSQEPALGPYSETGDFSPRLNITFNIHFNISPIYSYVFQVVSSFQVFRLKSSMQTTSLNAYYMYHPSPPT